MSSRRLVMLVAIDVDNYDELFAECRADHPDWNDYQIESHLLSLSTWNERFYQSSLFHDINNQNPYQMVIKDV